MIDVVRMLHLAAIVAALCSIVVAELEAAEPCPDETLYFGETPTTFARDASYELGTRFRAERPGAITHVRAYVGAKESGTHKVRIWRVSDKKLLAGPFSWNVPLGAAGWRTLKLQTPLRIVAGDHIVSIANNPTNRWYATDNGGFDQPRDNGMNITAPIGAGVFSTSLGQMPTRTWNNSDYFRDVIFAPDWIEE